MQRFLEFMGQYDDEFARRIRGAAVEEIDALEHLVGVPLPEDYRIYLNLMGRYDDGLDMFVDAHADIGEIEEYYAESKAEGLTPAPPGGVMAAIDGVGVNDFCLMMDTSIFHCDRDVLKGQFSESLRKLAYGTGFERYHARYKPSAIYVSKETIPLRAAVSALGHQLQFEEKEFSDFQNYYAERSDVSISFYQPKGVRASMRIACATWEDVDKMGGVFASALELAFDARVPPNLPIYRRRPYPG